MSKADYVKGQGQTRPHDCHWPGCGKQVPPAMFMCKTHWFKLPPAIRAEIWRTYRPGQEEDMGVSEAYIHAAERAQEWIRTVEAK